MNWFDVDKKGLAKLLEKKGKSFILYELIQNCWDENTTKVAVTLQRSGEWAIVTVKDTGVGIAPQERAHIFERFYRVDETRVQHRGGAGLGLAIVAHIVQSHVGQIDIQSTLGSGSTFTVKLPAVRKS